MRRVLARDPAIMDAHLTLGNWLMKARRADEAIDAFKHALALKPNDDIAMANLTQAYRLRHRTEDALAALAVYREALAAGPKNPQAWYQLATFYVDLGRLDEADKAFHEALDANPKMGAAWNGLGGLAFVRGDIEGAERLVRKGLELEPELRTGRYNLARILESRGQLAAAERLYREELATYPDHGKARFNLAQLLRQRGDQAGYLAELRASVEKAPDFGPSFFFLAREELNAGRLPAASDLAERGLKAEPLSPVAPLGHYVLADVYSRKGETAKAQEEVSKARRLEAGLRKTTLPRL
jgi:tetratricopeptide (TPR) repeat protein